MDKDLWFLCADCQVQFSWTVGEQRFWKFQGWTDPPRRCLRCRERRKRLKQQSQRPDREYQQGNW